MRITRDNLSRPQILFIEALLLLVAAGVMLGQEQDQNRPAADLIITNAKVYTVDKQQPRAEAVAVLGERITAVGSASAIDAWRGPGTRVIDAGGRLVSPGFNDAHVHFLDSGLGLASVQLKDAGSPQEFAERIAEYAAKQPKGRWILGGTWDEQRWNPPQLPTRELIDRLTPDNPVAVGRYDGHMYLANSLALKLAHITASTPDPPGGEIGRDAHGNPTGILKDAAQKLIDAVIPPLSHQQRLETARRALAYARSVGVTSVQEMGNPGEDLSRNLEVYKELEEKGELTTRIYVAPMITDWQNYAKAGIRRAFGSNLLRTGALKAFADGSLGSTTAYFFQSYSDDRHTRGLLTEEMQPLSKMRNRLIGADRAGLQLCVHAIGDEAISLTLDLFQDVIKADGRKDRRLRIEHAQHIAPKDFDRFAQLGVIASVQPYHAIDDGRWAEKRIGPERIKTSYAYRSLLDHGVRLALGTDWDVAPLNPLLTIYAAVTRATLDGRNPNGWMPEQKLTVAQAVEAYTMGSAYAEFQEKEKGSITPGKLADMVILSDDIFTIDPKLIRTVQVDTTIMDGKVVWQRSAQ
ncbi:MAG TPA: amidohydrolase [Terriglobales bacterium]|nr:amidohydrolase [Terriglobales bacterium]